MPVLMLASALALLTACASRPPPSPALVLSRADSPAARAHGAEAYFDAMAIEIAPPERAQFVAGDNRAGYYEGFTHGYVGGVGYRIGEASAYVDRVSFVDGSRLRREADASRERILPFGHVTDYQRAREGLLLHSGRSAISLRLETDLASELALQPLWSEGLQQHRLQLGPGVLLLAPPEGANNWVAISADRSLRIERGASFSRAENRILGAREGALSLRLHSLQPATRLTLHIVFADSRDSALSQARSLAEVDSWTDQLALQHQRLSRAELRTPDADYNRALAWAQASSLSFVVDQYGPGIWAGLPWFRDNWGRDTFIALPGTLLVSGLFDEARAVLGAFAQRQQRDPASPDYGRVPNRVASNQPVIYNTVDGTPWLLRAGLEYVRYSGDREFAAQLVEVARFYIDGAQRHLDADGLLRHADADTWMDARVYENGPAWSPRGDRAVEIQALWITALESAAELAEAGTDVAEAAAWRGQAQRARSALLKRFWDGQRVADRLRPDGSRDLARRPNALMLLSVPWTPLLTEQIGARLLRDTVEHLLLPYGIASLEPAHPHFHPRHENADLHHKDAAYHNGTVWGWNAGFTVTALNNYGQQALAWRLSRELGRQILELGTRGSMSELLDAAPANDGQPRPSGTYAQSWSVAEFSRNAYQDYLGFRPDLLRNTLALVPALPAEWTDVRARLPFGQGETLQVRITQACRPAKPEQGSAPEQQGEPEQQSEPAARCAPLSPCGRGVGGEGPSPRKAEPPLPNPSPSGGEGLQSGEPEQASESAARCAPLSPRGPASPSEAKVGVGGEGLQPGDIESVSPLDATDPPTQHTRSLTEWHFSGLSGAPRWIQMDLLASDGSRQRARFELRGLDRSLRWDGRRVELDGAALPTETVQASVADLLQGLDFATPPAADADYPVLRRKDALRSSLLGDQSP